MSGLYLGSCRPNFKFAPLAILELLAFSAQKIKGHMTLTPPPFRRFFQGHFGTLPGIMHAKFHQNPLKIATVKARARTHKSVSDIGHGNDFIFCPMLLSIYWTDNVHYAAVY